MADPRFYLPAKRLALSEISTLSGADFGPNASDGVRVSGLAPIGASQPSFLSYAEKSVDDVASGAIVLTSAGLADHFRQLGAIVGIAANPRGAFALSAAQIIEEKPILDGAAEVHSSAYVGPNVSLGEGVKIGANAVIHPGAVLGPGVEIGEGSLIGANTFIQCAIIGKACIVRPSTVIGKAGFGVVLGGERRIRVPHFGRVIIGDDVSIGSSCVIDRGVFGDTLIGDNCQFDNHCQISHNVQIDTGCVFAAYAGISGSTRIGKNVIFSGQCATKDNVTIGDGAVLMADTAALSDVPAGEKWMGRPAVPYRDYVRQRGAIKKLMKNSGKT